MDIDALKEVAVVTMHTHAQLQTQISEFLPHFRRSLAVESGQWPKQFSRESRTID